MELSLSEKKRPKILIIWVAIIIGIIIVTSVVLYYYNPPNVEAPAEPWLKDLEGDVILNLGTDYPGMIDVTYAELEVSEGLLNLTIDVMGPVPEFLNDGEYAHWVTTIVLEDDLDRTYEVYMEMNSTINQGELMGYFKEIGEEEPVPCVVEVDGNSLIISAALDGLQSAKEIQWLIQTSFEKRSDFDPVTNGYDFAPDEGFQRTIL